MLKQQYHDANALLCAECNEAIFNPLCPKCLAREINSWLYSYPGLRGRIITKINKLVNNKSFNHGMKCAICKKNSMFLCPYCFTEMVLQELKKEGAPRSVLKEFLQFFNFDFEHTGYSKEAEKLGVI